MTGTGYIFPAFAAREICENIYIYIYNIYIYWQSIDKEFEPD